MAKAHKRNSVVDLGHYRTREGCEVIIIRIVGNRAYGRLMDSHDTTWWYADSGEHAVYTPDDLIEKIIPDQQS